MEENPRERTAALRRFRRFILGVDFDDRDVYF